jgi:Rrf2 family protein
MRISAKGEYAIKAVLDLALHHGPGLIPIQEIADRQGIPQRYLEQVLLALKRDGLLTSKRGASGGYHLTRAPEDITVGAVLRAVEGNGAPFEVTGSTRGQDLAGLWEEIAGAVSQVIDRLTFEALAARVRERRGATRAMYHI